MAVISVAVLLVGLVGELEGFSSDVFNGGYKALRQVVVWIVWLVRVVSDPDKREGGPFKPYWFVLVKGFDPVKDPFEVRKRISVVIQESAADLFLSVLDNFATFDEGGGSQLAVAGRFNAEGGIAASNLAAWDGTQWRPLGAGLS